MTGDIQSTQKSTYAGVGIVMTFNCATDSTLIKGQEVMLSASNTVVARTGNTLDNYVGIVDSLPKNGKVGIRTAFLAETYATSADGTTSLGANGIGVKSTGAVLNGKPVYAIADMGNHYAAVILDNSDPANTCLGILYTPRISTYA
ncbi:hypothetical protein [Bernardetia sp.]|uniref:hypothetical protein n=1 Tax=Bernardetia sp. TaxID=1937974 RepID=UPI0025BAFD8D|nr:hypothetical protein [Bernardetia sp.]